MEPDGNLGILLPEQGHPAVHVIRIVDTPVIGAAAAFPVSPDIRHQHIVSPGQIDPGIGDAHGPVLVQSVEQDHGFVAAGRVFHIGPLEPGTVFGCDGHPLPAVFPLQGVDGVQIIPVILDGQQLVPGLGEQLGVGGIPGIDSQAQKQEQGQEYQVFDEIPEKTHS